MPLQATSGAASYDAFGGGVPFEPIYIEQVFQNWLYTGNDSTLTINNGIDLAGKGGLIWSKTRNMGPNAFVDTVRGTSSTIYSNTTQAAYTGASDITSFGSSGYSLGYFAGDENSPGAPFASWTFREQPKFFDVVTYTGTDSGSGTDSKTITHNLGSTPGCVFVKRTDAGDTSWKVWHTSTTNSGLLNTTGAFGTGSGLSTSPRYEGYISATTSTTFTVSPGGGNNFQVNANGGTYVAYLFAHNAGGFGLTGTDNVISCGSFTTDTSGNATVNLGYEPQWLLVKSSSTANSWYMVDSMRGNSVLNGANNTEQYLQAQSSAAEASTYGVANPTATGFVASDWGASPITFIYIAIRRGPMKVPTDGTKVFAPIAKTGDGSTTTVTNVGFPADLFMFKWRALAYGWKQQDRLRGFPQQLSSDATSAESDSGTYTFGTVNNTGYTYGSNASTSGELNGSGVTSSVLAFGRAPGFFDEVCYTGTGSAQTLTHNLAATPELIITKNRTQGNIWYTYSQTIGATKFLRLNTTDAEATGANVWNNTAPTSTQFTVGSSLSFSSGDGFVAYLFASCPGVSKVGSYTGNGTTQAIACGFTGGARFVLIKRTDSTGDWYVWDSARGIVAGNDPYLLLNSTAAEVTSTDYVDTAASGFELTSTAPAAINASGGTYIFLAIA